LDVDSLRIFLLVDIFGQQFVFVFLTSILDLMGQVLWEVRLLLVELSLELLEWRLVTGIWQQVLEVLVTWELCLILTAKILLLGQSVTLLNVFESVTYGVLFLV
jgi:hypothetical protein